MRGRLAAAWLALALALSALSALCGAARAGAADPVSAPGPAGAASAASAASAPDAAARVTATAPNAAPPPAACPPPLPAPDAAAAARDRGFLWRIKAGGRTSWLYGTLHVGRPGWRRLGPRTAQALRDTDVLALELDPGDPAVLAALLVNPAAPALPPALAERLGRAAERACFGLAAIAPLHPVLQATTLTVLEARWFGLDAAFASETLLAERARAARQRVVSLETAEQQKAVLVPLDPDEAVATVDQTLAQIENGTSRRMLGLLAAAWERGDLATLEAYESWCECAADEDDRAFLRRLNDDRNGPLADAIAALHAKGRRVFAAVGALHMTGAMALPRLMAERGFKVERIEFAPR